MLGPNSVTLPNLHSLTVPLILEFSLHSILRVSPPFSNELIDCFNVVQESTYEVGLQASWLGRENLQLTLC